MLGHCSHTSRLRPRFCWGGATYTFPSALLPHMLRCRAGMARAEDVAFSWCALAAGAVLFFLVGTEVYAPS